MLADLWEMYVLRYKIRVFLGICMLFLVSLVMSCQELRYMVSSKRLDVTVSTRVERRQPRHGSPYMQRVVIWNYPDGAITRFGYMDVAMDWESPGTMTIQYIPGRDASRVQGKTNMVWIIIFLGSIALVVVGVIILARTG